MKGGKVEIRTLSVREEKSQPSYLDRANSSKENLLANNVRLPQVIK